MKQGFTLIELLVVVLIIGILAAVALPQYQKTVEKSRVAEAYAIASSMKKAVDAYILENGVPTSSFTDGLALDIEISCPVTKVGIEWYNICKDFVYQVYCNSNSCTINAFRYHKSDYSDMRSNYTLSWKWNFASATWSHTCIYYTQGSLGHSVCNALPDAKANKWTG